MAKLDERLLPLSDGEMLDGSIVAVDGLKSEKGNIAPGLLHALQRHDLNSPLSTRFMAIFRRDAGSTFSRSGILVNNGTKAQVLLS